jgi:signal transduction histidine kinase/CheY-like chemotaxis protein
MLLKANGERIPILKTVVPLIVRGRRHLLEVFVDITERKRIEGEILRARDAAEAANVAKSQFLANMSHEIRTPLNAIIGFTNILRKSAMHCGNAECDDFLETIHSSGKHLLDLINDILDLSKIEADRLEIERVRCSPHEIISEVISVLRVRALEKGLNLHYAWRSGVPETVSTDPARFRQLLVNLVGNAIKFTQSGEVRIVADLVQDPPDPHLVIQVIDTGIGIAADKFESIFDPFVQADASVTRQFGGTGLGLTISRRIALALGGDIGVSSEIGQGSTFTVSIATGPLEDVPIRDFPPTECMRIVMHPAEEPLPSLAGVRVLLVEDGDTNRKLVNLMLRRAGANVTMAENGRLGVELAMKNPFDLILMDMQMPVMDGYAATTLLRQQGLTLPILALTAHAMKGDESRCRVAGCSGYVAKPIDGDQLVRTVAGTLGDGWDASAPGRTDGISPEARETAPRLAQATNTKSSPRAGASTGEAILSTLPTDDPDFREIVVEFAERLDEKLNAMRQANGAKDFQELACLAHWLKGAGGTAGFPAFTQPAKHLESQAHDQQCDEIDATLAELTGLAKRIAVSPARPASAQG